VVKLVKRSSRTCGANEASGCGQLTRNMAAIRLARPPTLKTLNIFRVSHYLSIRTPMCLGAGGLRKVTSLGPKRYRNSSSSPRHRKQFGRECYIVVAIVLVNCFNVIKIHLVYSL
jgi:hypothetical protein